VNVDPVLAPVGDRFSEVQQDYLERQWLYPWVIWSGRAFGVLFALLWVSASFSGLESLEMPLFAATVLSGLVFGPTNYHLGSKVANACGVTGRRARSRFRTHRGAYGKAIYYGVLGVRRRRA
jgi:hypothetical protein